MNNILHLFIKYVSLNVLGMIGLSCYILADTFFVARGIGSDGLTALNIAIPIFNFVNGIGLMLGMGSATKYAILKAQNKNNEANIVFTNSLIYILIISVLFITLSILFTSSIAYILGARGNIHSMTNIYIKMILLFSPMFMLNNVLLGFVRNDNHPRLAMIAMLMGSLFNIVFDYIFIFPFNMGIFGAVLATVFSPVVSILILSVLFIKKKNTFFIVKPNISFIKCEHIYNFKHGRLITTSENDYNLFIQNDNIISIHVDPLDQKLDVDMLLKGLNSCETINLKNYIEIVNSIITFHHLNINYIKVSVVSKFQIVNEFKINFEPVHKETINL